MCEDGVNHVSVCRATSLPPAFSSSCVIAVINLYQRPDACIKISTAHVRLVPSAATLPTAGVSRIPPIHNIAGGLTAVLVSFRVISLAVCDI